MFIVKRADWATTEQTHYLTKGKSYFHTVCGCSYVEGMGTVCVNSRGKEWGDGGYFYIPDEVLSECISQAYVVVDSDDTDQFSKLLYKSKIRSAVHILSEQWKHGTAEEKEAMNFANSMLRKLCLGQDHQRNMNKEQVLDFVNRNF